MGATVTLDNLEQEIRKLSHTQPSSLEESLEQYLERELRDTPLSEKLSLLEKLLEKFPVNMPVPQGLNLAHDETERVLSLLSGTRIDLSDHSSKEVSAKFAASLNTLFDTLNQIIAVIHSNLLGEKPELETIRHVIGSQIEGGGGNTSLKAHLEQIQQAFLISHRAFQEASRSVVGEMLVALDPENIAASTKSMLNFGPMRKAELFEAYQGKYLECRKWFDTGRFSERLLREFEKICQKKYKAE
ncbi:MAG: hypothetical protein HXX11_06545 [Desulfuromonadales bacterium]|nr:hypothetical protein [Desulfuromonadales bacterium]